MRRQEQIVQLQTGDFDLCIIGAGAAGAGCALDAALRGWKVALIDAGDFAGETSSKSTKLIHGGVRYLEQAIKKFDWGQLRQVRHGLQERRLVIAQAPHLAHPLGLLTPVYSIWESWYYFIGLRLYDWFAAGNDHLPKSRRLSRENALQLAPQLSGKIRGAVLYYDGRLDDARYCLALVQSAVNNGAVASNYLEAVAFNKDAQGKLLSLSVRNHVSEEGAAAFDIRAKIFLNCSGAHADRLRQMANSTLPSRICPSKGVHLMLPGSIFKNKHALLIPRTRDGRVVFAIPFADCLMLGTTDQEWKDGEVEPLLEMKEVGFLLDTLQPYLEEKIDRKSVQAGFGGLRPLTRPGKYHSSATKTLLRDHEVERDPASGLLSLMGGKWTTYRLMAQDAVDLAAKWLGKTGTCSTAGYPLHGSKGWNPDFWKKIAIGYGFDADVSQHLAANYGVHAEAVARMASSQSAWRERLLPGQPFLLGEVAYAVEHEMARTLRDFLARRIRLEICHWEHALLAAGKVAGVMGALLGWAEAQQNTEMETYRQLIRRFQQHAFGDT